MEIILTLIKLAQVGATLAPAVQQLRGKDPREAEAVEKLLTTILGAVGRGAAGMAFLQTLSAQLEALHAEGKTITALDLQEVASDISRVSAEIEAERAKLDPPPVDPPPVDPAPVDPPPAAP